MDTIALDMLEIGTELLVTLTTASVKMMRPI